jgi:phytoene desaturase
MDRKVAIIGGGLTGLSAGIQLQKQGVSTEIFERAPWAGGVCTAWIRKGYTFDGCIHWMVGTKANESMRRMYESVHALEPETKIFNMDFLIMEIDQKTYTIPLTLNQFQESLLEIAPEDRVAIIHLVKAIKRVTKSQMIPGSPKSFKDLVYAMTRGRGFLLTVIKYLNVTVHDYCTKFSNETIKSIIFHLMDPSFSMFALLMMLGTRMAKNGGFPLGGARDMIQRMERYYLSLGGTLTLNTHIDEIVIDQGKAVGIKSGIDTYPATHVIAAGDVHHTLKTMLKDQYPHPVLNRMLDKTPLFQPLILVSLGLNRVFDIPYSATYDINGVVDVGNSMFPKQYHIRSFDFDKSMAPKGHSSVMIMLPASFDHWYHLRNTDQDAYRKAKKDVSDQMIAVLEKRYPGITQAVEVVDVATPSTYHRLNHLYQGSYEGFLPVPSALKEKIHPQIPGIANLWLAGQWVTPGGGIPPAIMSGIETANQIIKDRSV